MLVVDRDVFRVGCLDGQFIACRDLSTKYRYPRLVPGDSGIASIGSLDHEAAAFLAILAENVGILPLVGLEESSGIPLT